MEQLQRWWTLQWKVRFSHSQGSVYESYDVAVWLQLRSRWGGAGRVRERFPLSPRQVWCSKTEFKFFFRVQEGRDHQYSQSHFILPFSPFAAAAKSLQSCPTLCHPIDSSPPVSPVPGILQERTLEWVAISFSNAWKWKVKMKSLSCVGLLATPWTTAYQAPPSMGFARQEYWSGLPLPSPFTAL